MPKLSLKYKLSQRYTNHSIRVTSVQTLEDVNVEGRHIVRISGHKSINSIQSYAKRLSAARKLRISATFANHLSSAEHETSNKVLKIVNNNESNDHDITAKSNIKQMSATMQSASCQSNPISVPGSNKNRIDFNDVDNVDDASLTQVPAEWSKSFTSFTNCNNCHFTFNVHVHHHT